VEGRYSACLLRLRSRSVLGRWLLRLRLLAQSVGFPRRGSGCESLVRALGGGARRGGAVVVGVVGVVGVWGLALRGLSGLLLGMHVSGADPHRWSSLAPLRHDPVGLVKNARGVVDGWQAYAGTESPGYANAWDVVQWGMGVDFFAFAPLYALGLVVFLRFARAQLVALPDETLKGTGRLAGRATLTGEQLRRAVRRSGRLAIRATVGCGVPKLAFRL
jgi:hypothetical protein